VIQHGRRGSNLIEGPRRCRLDIDDDRKLLDKTGPVGQEWVTRPVREE
jgi:hypothetical protein